jgi:type I restriction enzyme M protein
MVKMGEVVETITPLKRIQKSAYASSGTYPIIDQSQEAIAGWTDDREAVVVPRKPVVIFGDHTCAVKFSDGPFAQGADGIKILETDTRLVPKFLYFWLRTFPTKAEGYKRHFAALQRIELPLPPLDEQERIVAELEGYRKVIEGARQILAAYKPTIWVDPRWPVKPLGDIIAGKPKNGYSGKPVDRPTKVKVLSLSATTSGRLDLSKFKYLDEEIDEDSPSRCRKGDIYLQRGNTSALVGTAALFDVDEKDYVYPDLMIRVRANESVVFSAYLLAAIQSPVARTFIKNNASGSAGSMPKINQSVVESIPIPLPPLSTQRRIAAELEAERKLVEANRELIARMEAKIKTKLAEVWGETG